MTPATSAGIMVWMMTAIGVGGMAMRVRFCPAKLVDSCPVFADGRGPGCQLVELTLASEVRIIRSCGFWQQLDANPVGVGEWSLRCGVDRGRGRSVLNTHVERHEEPQIVRELDWSWRGQKPLPRCCEGPSGWRSGAPARREAHYPDEGTAGRWGGS